MSTVLAREQYCSWCGRDEAGLRCLCRQVSYCGRECQVAAWSEHRLICFKGPANKNNSLGSGDIVKIDGLQSESARSMNGSLAEVAERLEDGRIKVVVTRSDTNGVKKIKTFSIKKENLSLELSTLEAAKQGRRLEKLDEEGKGPTPINNTSEAITVATRLLASFTANDIVRRLRSDNFDKMILMTLTTFPTPTSHQLCLEAMLQQGLVTVCLEKIPFPQAIDLLDIDQVGSRSLFMILLSNSVVDAHYSSTQEKAQLHALRLDIVRRIGPLILVMASKKKRLFGTNKNWIGSQTHFMYMLANCFVAHEEITSTFIKENDPLVVNTLTEHLVFCLTVDPSLYLRNKSCVAPGQLTEEGSAHMEVHYSALKMASLAILKDFFIFETVGKRFVQRLAQMVVPVGAPGPTGQTLGQCFLELAARVALALDAFVRSDGGRNRPIYIELQLIDRALRVCCSPNLICEEDTDFMSVDSQEAFIMWANSRIAESA